MTEAIHKRMIALGAETQITVEASGGWEFEAAINGEEYIFYVHWAPIGDPPEDCWVVQTRKKMGSLKSLFGTPRNPAVNMQPGIDLLKRVIDEFSDLQDVRWMAAKQFSEIY